MSIFKENESLEALGEFGLIERISGLFSSNENNDFTGIGDDCAVIKNDHGKSLLITTDMLLEGRHFRRDWISPADLGYKSLAVNLSDVSAMGGVPRYAFLSIGLPPDTSPEWLNSFFDNASSLCEAHGVNLAGGDTAQSNFIIINYTVLGYADDDKILYRSSAKPGDKIGLIGNVGESGAGLRLLEKSYNRQIPSHKHLIKAHNRPRVYINEAEFLAEIGYVHSMIDLSDGIQSDATHIAEQSRVTLSIDTGCLNLSEPFTEVCKRYSWLQEEVALTAGEDYALLFTFDSNKEDDLQRQLYESFPETAFSVIGDVEEGDAEVLFIKNGIRLELQRHGFDQFKSE